MLRAGAQACPVVRRRGVGCQDRKEAPSERAQRPRRTEGGKEALGAGGHGTWRRVAAGAERRLPAGAGTAHLLRNGGTVLERGGRRWVGR